MNNETKIVQFGDWVVRQRLPIESGPKKLLLLLHGWTGNENSMWIFTPRIPQSYLILSPRGMFRTPLGGFGWSDSKVEGWSTLKDFQPAATELLGLIGSMDLPDYQVNRIDVIGFSQGAALAFALLLLHPERINKVAGLSGFFPQPQPGAISGGVLDGKKIFIAHGIKDELVPVEKARQVVSGLKSFGAEVVYCEEDVGHRLSAGCFRGMDEYFRN